MNENFKKAYEETLSDIASCCDCWRYELEEVDGICPNCGRATVDGRSACGCYWSPVECETCEAQPCDGSC